MAVGAGWKSERQMRGGDLVSFLGRVGFSPSESYMTRESGELTKVSGARNLLTFVGRHDGYIGATLRCGRDLNSAWLLSGLCGGECKREDRGGREAITEVCCGF